MTGRPFSPSVLTSPLDDELDVGEIHAFVSDELATALAEVERDGRSRSVLLLGPPGAGKTHVLMRLRRRVAARGLFVVVTPRGDESHPFIELASSLADSLSLCHADADPPLAEVHARDEMLRTPADEESAFRHLLDVGQILAGIHPIVLVADHLERLAGGSQGPERVRTLVKALCRLRDGGAGFLVVVACDSDDWVERLSPSLTQSQREALGEYTFTLQPLRPGEVELLVRRRLVQPGTAGEDGAAVEPAVLVARICEDLPEPRYPRQVLRRAARCLQRHQPSGSTDEAGERVSSPDPQASLRHEEAVARLVGLLKTHKTVSVSNACEHLGTDGSPLSTAELNVLLATCAHKILLTPGPYRVLELVNDDDD